MGIRQSLLGMFQQNPDQFQTLLGQYYDPKQAKMQWLGGTLQGLGQGLASGEPGAWAQDAIAGGGQGVDDYKRQALLGYKVGQDQQDQAWQNKAHARQEQEWNQEDANGQQINSMLGSISDPGQRMWAQMDPKGYLSNRYGQHESKAPSSVQEYQYAVGQGFKGSYMDYEASKRGNGISIDKDGNIQIGGNIKPMTEGQSKDTVFATRAEGALPYVDQNEAPMTDPGQVMKGAIPFVGNYATSKEYQVGSSAGKEFLQALLRKDTGASIQPFEMQEYGSLYLPEPGDKPERLAYKKEARHRALAAIKAGMTPQAIVAQEKALATPGASGGAAPAPAQPTATIGASGTQEGTQFEDPAEIPEGAIVVDDSGVAYQKINGQLVKRQ